MTKRGDGIDASRPGQRYLRPAEASLKVSMPPPAAPRTRLPAEGTWVKFDTYWSRRLHTGDVVACDPPVQVRESKRPSKE